MTLKEAATKFRKDFGDSEEGYRTFMVGVAEKSQYNPEDYLVVYLTKKVHHYKFPENYEGFRVEVKYSGPIKIGK